MTGKTVYNYILSRLSQEKIHMTLLDPAKMGPEEIGRVGEIAEKIGSAAIMIGGSTHLSMELVDKSVLEIRKRTSLPVILFPTAAATLSRHADALYYMSMLNSTDIRYLTGEQRQAVPFIKQTGIEPIPMGYIIVEPGMTVGKIGRATPLKRDEPEIAVSYCLMAQYFGMSLVYLEAGSGAPEPVPVNLISAVKEAISIPLIVGGGIRTPEQARAISEAGADIIVTGTLVEEAEDVHSALTGIVEGMKGAEG